MPPAICGRDRPIIIQSTSLPREKKARQEAFCGPAAGLDAVTAGQAQGFGDPVELVERIEIDRDAAALAISPGLNNDACTEVAMQFRLQIQDVRGLGPDS